MWGEQGRFPRGFVRTSCFGLAVWIGATPAVERGVGSWGGVVGPAVEGEGHVADGFT